MGIAPPSPQQPMSEDPDDFRPASSWRLVVDPDGHVDMSVIYESIGVGDKIPRHWHDVDEIIIERGEATVHVGGAWMCRMGQPCSYLRAQSMSMSTAAGFTRRSCHGRGV